MLAFLKKWFRKAGQEPGEKTREHQALMVGLQDAEEGQRKSEEHFRHLVAGVQDYAIFLLDSQGHVLTWNDGARQIKGYSEQEIVGQHFSRFYTEDDLACGFPAYELNEAATAGRFENEGWRVRKDGSRFWANVVITALHDDAGNLQGFLKITRDLTERRQAEENARRLIEEEASREAAEALLHLAAIVESSDDAIISKNLEGTIISWNKGAERLYGYSAEEVIGKPLAMLVPADSPDELPALTERLRRGERIDHFETFRLRKDGSRVEVSLTISPVRNADGKIVGASKIARDITAAKRNEADLRFLSEVEKLLAELLDVPSTLQNVAGLAVPRFADWCAVDMLEPDGSLRRMAVAHVDPAKVRLAHELSQRYPPDPASPHGVWNILRTGTSERIAEIPDSMLTAAARDENMLRTLRELGLKSYMGVPLLVRGKSIGVITFIAAESGRRYEPADLRLAEELAQRAAIAIENARLYGELKEADRRKDEFLAMLAHELRNPLAPIRNAMHLMGMPGIDAATIEEARQITERQVSHMVRLVDDLLDVSRIMRGRIELRKELVDLKTIIAGAVETARPMIDERGQQLIVTVTLEPLRLEADPTRLTQVTANLLHNAAKFSDRAGRIWLTVERQNNDAVIRVRDEGAGIRAELLPHIFDLFVQEDSSLERSRGGLGIGLTIVKRLVEQHGGTIVACSKGLGKGSEFIVRLPGLLNTSGAQAARPSSLIRRSLVSRRVLVVDDNVDAAESIAMLLRLWGHEIRMVHNGPEALMAAEEYRPEVVVLDIGLPGMNGYEVGRELRRQPWFEKVLLVAVTGYGQEEDRFRTDEVGFDHHLTKPVNPASLEHLLSKLT